MNENVVVDWNGPLGEDESGPTKEVVVKNSALRDWLMPSPSDLLFLVCLYWGLDFGIRFLFDGDIFWHILTGQRIIDTLQIPFVDEYSHTVAGTSWTAHEWLSEIILASVYKWTGLNGVILLSVIIVSLTFAVAYRFSVYRKANPIIAFFLISLAAYVSRTHWLARPHLFSFLLLLSFFIILELYQREKLNYLKALPVLMVLWVNLHASFVFGLMLLFLYAGGNLILLIATKEREERAKRELRTLWLYSAVTMLATFINPRGFSILLFPFHLTGSANLMNNISEWMSPDFHNATISLWLLLAVIAILMMAGRRPDIFEAGLFFILFYMSLYASRYLAIFAILMPMVVASRAAEVLDTMARNLKHIVVVDRMHKVVSKVSRELTLHEQSNRKQTWKWACIAFCMAISLNAGRLGSYQVVDFRVPKDNFPVDALRFALKNDIGGKMFNQEYWGGYILLKSFPRYKVFVDGRLDMYGDEFMLDYLRVSTGGSRMVSVLEKYGATWIIDEAKSPACRALEASKQWKLVYADGFARILLKDIPENRSIIDKYPNVQHLAAGLVPLEEEEDWLDR